MNEDIEFYLDRRQQAQKGVKSIEQSIADIIQYRYGSSDIRRQKDSHKTCNSV